MPVNPLGHLLRNRRAGHDTLAWAQPDLRAPETFTLSSPAFDGGAPIPELYRGRLRGENVSPPLGWTEPPAGTAELVLIVQDPDVPFGKAAVHALTVGIDPALGAIPERGLRSDSPVAGLRHGRGALGRTGWAGPLPPRSHGSHDYVFQMFAVDEKLDLPASFGLDDVLAALPGHLVDRAMLTGTYENR